MIRKSLCICAIFVLVGCAQLTTPASTQKQTAKTIDALQENSAARRSDSLSGKSEKIFLGRNITASLADKLPHELEKPDGFEWLKSSEASMTDVAARIAEISVKRLGRALNLEIRECNRSSENSGNTQTQVILAAANGGMVFPAETSSSSNTVRLVPSYRGPLSGFLQELSMRFDAAIDYSSTRRQITIACNLTRVYPIKASTTKTEYTTTVAGSAVYDAKGISTSQMTKQDAQLDVWSDIDKQLKELMGNAGKYALSRSIGSVIVYGSASVHDRVSHYLNEVNKTFSDRISLEITAIFVQMKDEQDYGFSLKSLYTNKGLNIGLTDLLPALSSKAATSSIAIISPPSGSTTAHFDTSKAMINAVASDGRLADVRNTTVFARNNTPSNNQLTSDRTVIQQIGTTAVANVSAQTTAQTTNITFGYSVQVLPRVIGNKEVAVSLTLTQSDLVLREEKRVSEYASIQLTEVPRRAFQQEISARSGETVVIAGYEMDQATNDNVGTGTPEFFGLGGSQKHFRDRTRIVLLVTPYIMPTAADIP